jgi:hypothetical protein
MVLTPPRVTSARVSLLAIGQLLSLGFRSSLALEVLWRVMRPP